jgi:hypothetical protein
MFCGKVKGQNTRTFGKVLFSRPPTPHKEKFRNTPNLGTGLADLAPPLYGDFARMLKL